MSYNSTNRSFSQRLQDTGNATAVFGLIIVVALMFFEIFNYSTTHFALKDLLGEQKFIGIPWATFLSIAFCMVDFAGISQMFTPEQGSEEPREIWYLFGAWMLAATMNAALTWWGVSMAIVNHSIASSAFIDPAKIIKVVPIFVAILVWVIRVLVIGSISSVGSRFLWNSTPAKPRTTSQRTTTPRISTATSGRSARRSPAPRTAAPRSNAYPRGDQTYHSLHTKNYNNHERNNSQTRNF
jgi:hypothetical protein